MKDTYFKDYEIEIASDVSERDGIGLNIYKNQEMIIEIFRDDSDKTFTLSCYEISLPLEFVEKAIELFKKKIPQEFIDYNSFE